MLQKGDFSLNLITETAKSNHFEEPKIKNLITRVEPKTLETRIKSTKKVPADWPGPRCASRGSNPAHPD